MTEEEAKKKICPFGVIAMALTAKFNTDVNVIETMGCCKGHMCPIWRGELSTVLHKSDDGNVNVNQQIDGYCGLGGRP